MRDDLVGTSTYSKLAEGDGWDESAEQCSAGEARQASSEAKKKERLGDEARRTRRAWASEATGTGTAYEYENETRRGAIKKCERRDNTTDGGVVQCPTRRGGVKERRRRATVSRASASCQDCLAVEAGPSTAAVPVVSAVLAPTTASASPARHQTAHNVSQSLVVAASLHRTLPLVHPVPIVPRSHRKPHRRKPRRCAHPHRLSSHPLCDAVLGMVRRRARPEPRKVRWRRAGRERRDLLL